VGDLQSPSAVLIVFYHLKRDGDAEKVSGETDQETFDLERERPLVVRETQGGRGKKRGRRG
jgi:hypothetical protein